MYKQPIQENDVDMESKSHSEEVKHDCIQICDCEPINIIPTYDNLKSEILALTNIQQYQRTYNKAKRFHKSFAMHKYETPSHGSLENKLFGIAESWKKGERITIDELFVLYLVVDFNAVQSALRKCTEQRLPHIFHLRRQLFIVVNKYGSQHFGKHDKLYLPVNDEMNTMGPLLVTSSFQVSEIIASKAKNGMTVTLMPQTNQWKAFDATKLPIIDPYKQQWLIDFECLRRFNYKSPHQTNHQLSTCKI